MFYRAGGALGLSPRDIDALTLAELSAVIEGFRRFHGADEAAEPDMDEFLRGLAEAKANGQA